MHCKSFNRNFTRRGLLKSSACGFGHVALSAILGKERKVEASSINPPGKFPHFKPRAKRIIFLFMWGGPSHVDLFDPKPLLNQRAGTQLHGVDIGMKKGKMGELLGSPFKFSQYGQSGIWMSQHLPELSKQADKLCMIRSMHTEGQAHGEALLRLHTGQANLVRPSVGAWVSYGLGNDKEDLPAFISISPPRGHGGVQNYGSAFLPSIHQGMAIGSAETPITKAKIPNLKNTRMDSSLQRSQLDLVQSLNHAHLDQSNRDAGIEGLIESYELAYRMQAKAPPIMDLESEPDAIREMYGIGNNVSDNFGRQCLLARKFAENGVRYIQVSTNYTWDHHQKVEKGTIDECAKVDRPIAGLLQDLDQRGLLEDTLVLWGGEFGRTPMVENKDGRNHHPQGFTVWMAGGGVKPGFTYGSTDPFGYRPEQNPVHMHDLHATMLYALGMDHERLTYRYAGRDFRLTDIHGQVPLSIFT